MVQQESTGLLESTELLEVQAQPDHREQLDYKVPQVQILQFQEQLEVQDHKAI
jgi:hypothetical protein